MNCKIVIGKLLQKFYNNDSSDNDSLTKQLNCIYNFCISSRVRSHNKQSRG